ncbi:uncharacterized protein LOC112684554 [Sipha flava]|uniref:Uncharacterized protein LOC112684554 n=1 Tax=Sipha flava TaxID=143950 RepID=A0A8B8FMM2_9HEMI|nr:uncharacterized protein LOC112684554 [Sipha flava]
MENSSRTDEIKSVTILPTSTADCERGFSDMNMTITDLRTSLNIENVSDLIFISTNGPSVADFNPRPYVKIWLKDHRSAVTALRDKERQESNDENKLQKMFFTNKTSSANPVEIYARDVSESDERSSKKYSELCRED